MGRWALVRLDLQTNLKDVGQASWALTRVFHLRRRGLVIPTDQSRGG